MPGKPGQLPAPRCLGPGVPLLCVTRWLRDAALSARERLRDADSAVYGTKAFTIV